jgi:hypothetical protein
MSIHTLEKKTVAASRGTPVRLTGDTHAALSTATRRLSADADRQLSMSAVVAACLVVAQRHPEELMGEVISPTGGGESDD